MALSMADYRDPFGLRIADFMTDLLPPNFDSSSYASNWQSALNDLSSASSNGEFTHVQLRTFWNVDPNTRSTWEYPELGGVSGGQISMGNNWERWVFDVDGDLPYGPCAAERIHNAGFNLEFCMSSCWFDGLGTIPDAVPVFKWGATEASYSFNGDLFLDNYWSNVLQPTVATLVASANFVDGDIFMLSFEMNYPTCDFTWSHNAKWQTIIGNVRQMFQSAGKDILLTIDHSGWYNDEGLGYAGVKSISASAPITAASPGISGATYLADLDFISVSMWNRMLPYNSPLVPAVWSDSDVSWVTDLWYENPVFYAVGTGYSGVSAVYGRNMIGDLMALYEVMGKRVLMNTGWRNGHGDITKSLFSPYSADGMEQKVLWVAQVNALVDARGGYGEWCAGQDFERYVRDKAAQPDYIDWSWRNSVAEDGIILAIQNAVSVAPDATPAPSASPTPTPTTGGGGDSGDDGVDDSTEPEASPSPSVSLPEAVADENLLQSAFFISGLGSIAYSLRSKIMGVLRRKRSLPKIGRRRKR